MYRLDTNLVLTHPRRRVSTDHCHHL